MLPDVQQSLIELRLTSDWIADVMDWQIKITPKSSAGEGATEKNSQEVLDTFTEELEDSNKTATRAELEAGKVARTEFLSLSVFKVRCFCS